MSGDETNLGIPAVAEGPPATKGVRVPDKKGGVKTISPLLKSALDKIVWEGADAWAAAEAVGLHTRSMRKALDRPHVIRYLREQRAAFRESLRASNMHYARKIRDEGANDAARVRVLSYIDGDVAREPEPSHNRVTPGVVVVINANPEPRVVDQTVIEVNPGGGAPDLGGAS